MPDHGHGGSPIPENPRPSFAEHARTLLENGDVSTLSTQSRKYPGYPFGSVVPYAPLDDGSPVFLISSMAVHTQNLSADPRATLLVLAKRQGDVQASGRLSLIGDVAPVGSDQVAEARESYLAKHPQSASWIDYNDFGLYKMTVMDIYFVGGFGMMGWVTADDFGKAAPDPLVEVADAILEHMNQDHADSVALLARVNGQTECEAATMMRVDRYGFSARAMTADGPRGVRVEFPREVQSSDEVRQVLVEMVKAARG